MVTNHSLTHSFSLFTHSAKRDNQGYEQGFPPLSTENPPSYYYYLYIYKTPSPTNLGFIKTINRGENSNQVLKVSQSCCFMGNFQQEKTRKHA
jgi:hypothetical protein